MSAQKANDGDARVSAVVVVGSLHYDIMVDAPDRPRKGETVAGLSWSPKFGGKGGNQALAAKGQGVPTAMVGAVGGDDFGATRLAAFMPAPAEVWDRIGEKHNLRRVPMAALLGESHHYADLLFAWNSEVLPTAMLVSTIKIRQAGFHDCVDTADSVVKYLRRWRDDRLLPPG